MTDITPLAEGVMGWEKSQDEMCSPNWVSEGGIEMAFYITESMCKLTPAGTIAVLEKLCDEGHSWKLNAYEDADGNYKYYSLKIDGAQNNSTWGSNIPTAVCDAALAWLREGE